MSDGSQGDIEALRAVLALARSEGARLAVVQVGGIRVQFAAPWPPPAETHASAQLADAAKSEAEVPEAIRELRRIGRAHFGRDLPDAQLREIAPIIAPLVRLPPPPADA